MSGIIHRGFGDGVIRIKKRPRWQLLDDVQKLESKLSALTAENKRMKEALEKIAKVPTDTKVDGCTTHLFINTQAIAKSAPKHSPLKECNTCVDCISAYNALLSENTKLKAERGELVEGLTMVLRSESHLHAILIAESTLSKLNTEGTK